MTATTLEDLICETCKDVCTICGERDCRKRGGTIECRLVNWKCGDCPRGKTWG